MKIAFFEVEDWEKKYLESKLAGHDLKFFSTHLTKDNAKDVKDFDVISIFLLSHLTPEVLEQLPALRLVTTRSTGFDHIDCPTCVNRKIIVSNVPHYGTHTVAEHAFALILAISRKIVKSEERTERGDFDHRDLTGFDLFGKTLGIVGLGDIGMSVLNIAKGFGMNVTAYAHHPDEALARKLGISFLTIPELLSVSDVITLHVPYMKETHHLINKQNIKKFKKGSVLINTARGGLVETEAIIYGLEKGILGGFGSDVLEEEDIIKEERQILSEDFLNTTNIKTLYLDHVLMGKENVVITPHNAFNSVEALHMILDITVDNILQFEKNNPQNTV